MSSSGKNQRSISGLLGIGSPALVLAACASACTAKLPEKPNILLIITDQQSAESMSNVLGDKYLYTPSMDYLAANGISFTNAYCANPLSVPSRASMFTGKYPHQPGIQSNSDNRVIDNNEFPSLGMIFSKAGYETGYAGKWHLPYDIRKPETHGFYHTGNIRNNGTDSALPATAAEFLKKDHTKPFLYVVSFVNPHNICEWARGQKLPDGPVGEPPLPEECPPLRLNHDPSVNETDIMQQLRRSYQAAKMFPVSGFSDDKWRQYTWAYYRMIEKTDEGIGKILDELSDSGLERNTIVILLSDHGDCQGAHRWNQKTVFFDEAARVPFIISHKAFKPGRTDYLVQTGIDLLPTLCDLAGINPGFPVPGTSLKELLLTGKPSVKREFIVVSNRSVQGDTIDGHKPEPDGRMLRTQRFKYWILDEGINRETLYDLENDPGEMKNLAGDPEYKKYLVECRNKLAGWARQYNDQFSGALQDN